MSTQPTITAFTEVWSRRLFEVPDTLNLILGNTVEIPGGNQQYKSDGETVRDGP